jgi:hypothetical protein
VVLLVEQFAISINFVSVFHLQYMVFWPPKVVSNTVMHATIRAMPWLQIMQVLKLLMLCWRSFSGWRREHGAAVFAIWGCQYLINGCLQPIGTYDTQHAKLKLVDAPLPLMLGMGKWPCCYLFCQYKLPIRPLCITTTKSLVNYCTYKTTNWWRSSDAHVKNGVVTMLLSLLPIQAANTSVMQNNDQVTGELPYF